VTFRGERSQQPALVAEVVRRCGMRDAGTPREFPQADAGRSGFVDRGGERVEQLPAQISVVTSRRNVQPVRCR
jgi:hypothetical protein